MPYRSANIALLANGDLLSGEAAIFCGYTMWIPEALSLGLVVDETAIFGGMPFGHASYLIMGGLYYYG